MNYSTAARSFKKFVFPLAFALAIGPALSGCTDAEVNTAIGVLAIGAGVAVIASGADYSHDYNHHRNRHWHNRHRFHSLANLDAGIPAMATVTANSTSVRAASEINTADFARTFSLSTKSASLFLSSMQRAKAGDPQAVQKLGLTKQDIKGLRRFQLPSEATIRMVAKNIQADVGTTRDMLSALIQKASEQSKAREIKGPSTRRRDAWPNAC